MHRCRSHRASLPNDRAWVYQQVGTVAATGKS
jgi:hypothetical protein